MTVYIETIRFAIEDAMDMTLDTYIDLYYSVQHGLALQDVKNVVIALLFFRFVIEVCKTNLKTAFAIVGVCLLSCILWQREFTDTIRHWSDLWEFLPYFKDFTLHGWQRNDYHEMMGQQHAQMISQRMPHWHQPHTIFWYTLVNMINRQEPDMQWYRTDPISMGLSALRLPLDSRPVYYYYKIVGNYFPACYTAFRQVWYGCRSMASFTFVTRVGKKHCPYFFRWHYTFLMIYETIMSAFEKLVIRAIFYWQEGVFNRIGYILYEADCKRAGYELEPPEHTAQNRIMYIGVAKLINTPWAQAFKDWNYDDANELKRLVFYNKVLLLGSQVIMCTHMCAILWFLFHAAFGQYMYVAFLTENVERHVEPRPKKSKYSCGHTAWQDVPLSVRAAMFPPKFWWGWLGRGTDKPNIFVYIPKQLFKMILRKTRNLLRRLKRKI